MWRSRILASRTLFFCVLCACSIAGIAAVASVPAGVKPLPTGSRGCGSDTTDADALEARGRVCLDALRFDRALPELQAASRIDPSACTLIELGVAYDGLSRRREAAAAWRRAALTHEHQTAPGPNRFSEVPLLHGHVARAFWILKRTVEPTFHADGTWEAYSGPDRGLAEAFAAAIERAVAGHPEQGTTIITDLYHRGLESNGAVRYARAIMLLALNRKREAQIELRLAAYHRLVIPGEDCVPVDYQWSAVDLLERLR